MKQHYTVEKKGKHYTVGRYKLNNKKDAEHLCRELNQKDSVRQLTAVIIDLKILKHDIEELQKVIQ